MVKKLAQKYHSTALAQLASRVSAEMRFGSGEDPFAKIKGMISDMIGKLEKEAEEEATEKAYCDEEMAKTETKKSELEDDVEKQTATIDQAVSKSTALEEQGSFVQEDEGSFMQQPKPPVSHSKSGGA